jgi:hypothetical protein
LIGISFRTESFTVSAAAFGRVSEFARENIEFDFVAEKQAGVTGYTDDRKSTQQASRKR